MRPVVGDGEGGASTRLGASKKRPEPISPDLDRAWAWPCRTSAQAAARHGHRRNSFLPDAVATAVATSAASRPGLQVLQLERCCGARGGIRTRTIRRSGGFKPPAPAAYATRAPGQRYGTGPGRQSEHAGGMSVL